MIQQSKTLLHKFGNIIREIVCKKRINSSQIKASSLCSFSNQVYKVEIENVQQFKKVNDLQELQFATESVYLLKIFRPIFLQFTSVQVENYVVNKLSDQNIYPQIITSNCQFRVQNYLDGKIPEINDLTQEQFNKLIDRLAFLPKHFQKIFESQSQNIPKLNVNSIQILYGKFANIGQQCSNKHPQDYKQIQKLINEMLNKQTADRLSDIVKDIPLIPSHNDCHLSNVLIHDNQLTLLDYQFFAYSYRGYDLGNFFNQCATDYISFQIKQQLQLATDKKSKLIQRYYQNILQEQYNQVMAHKEVLIGRMISHLFWFFIGVKQIKDDKIEFDMKYYIKRRHQQFFKYYKELI